MDNANIYVHMTSLIQGNNGVIYTHTNFQTGHKDYW